MLMKLNFKALRRMLKGKQVGEKRFETFTKYEESVLTQESKQKRAKSGKR